MKPSNTLRSLLALSILASLAACGGKNGTYDLGGTITGTLNYDGLVLANGATTITVPKGSVGYLFPAKLSYGTVFNVTVQTNPANQKCGVISGNTGSAGTSSTTAGIINCVVNAVFVGGVIHGLKLPGLEIHNGADIANPNALNGTTGADVNFQMPSPVSFGTNYGLTIAKQPVLLDAAGNVISRQVCSFQLNANNISTGVGTVDATTSPFTPGAANSGSNGGSNANISTVVINCI
jgi:hypothetical protein